MSTRDLALRVEGVGKRYRIGIQEKEGGGMYRYGSLRDSFCSIAKRPIRTLRKAVIPEPMNEENSFWALKDINFEIKKGEVVGIIGRNGAGKSTLLKILSQITTPTTGKVDLFGRVGSLLEVGTGFHPELTGRENIYLNGAVLGMTRAEVKSRFDEIVSFSEVETFIDTPVKHYSSGMYMRLGFAVAAHLEPEILVVDEVLAVGDTLFQRKCLGKMRDCADQGRTVLFVSHNMGAVRELCDSGCQIHAGQVLRRGEIRAVIQGYLSVSNPVTSVEANELCNQKYVGPARILRCGIVQDDHESGYFVPELPLRVYADVQHEAGAYISFGIRIRTGLGQEILHVTSQDEVDSLRLPGQRARLWIDLPQIPFNDGEYYLLFYLGDRFFQLQHLLEDAVTFTVDTSHRGHSCANAPLKVTSEWSWEVPAV